MSDQTAPEDLPDRAQGESLVDAEVYNAFVSAVTLDRIEVVKVMAERRAPGDVVSTDFDLEASYLIGERSLHWRFDCTATAQDDDGETLGDVEASVLVTMEYGGGDEPSEMVMRQFASSSVVFLAYPYLREAIATTALRIGLPDVLLPLVRS